MGHGYFLYSIEMTKVKHGELNAEDNGTKQLNQHGRETTYLYKIVGEIGRWDICNIQCFISSFLSLH
jgi:hypothetical protein